MASTVLRNPQHPRLAQRAFTVQARLLSGRLAGVVGATSARVGQQHIVLRLQLLGTSASRILKDILVQLDITAKVVRGIIVGGSSSSSSAVPLPQIPVGAH